MAALAIVNQNIILKTTQISINSRINIYMPESSEDEQNTATCKTKMNFTTICIL